MPQMKFFPLYSIMVACVKMIKINQMDGKERTNMTKVDGKFSG